MNIALPRTINRRPVRGQNTDSILLSAITASIGLHAIILLIHFSNPDTFRFKSTEQQLDVILVNAKGTKPTHATALAQTDLDGGGAHDKGRATSFLPRADAASDGDSPDPMQGQVAELEAKRQQLMVQAQQLGLVVESSSAHATDNTEDNPELNNRGTPHSEMARLEAEVSKEINDYNARPRRGFIGPSVRKVSYATYYRNWVDMVERYGNLNYPPEAKGKLYGDVTVSVTLDPTGHIYDNEIRVVHKSGYPVLDQAARRTVALGGPYPHFTAEMKKDFQVYELIVVFHYLPGDRVEAQSTTTN